jgi:type I restriction enzyme R subunit
MLGNTTPAVMRMKPALEALGYDVLSGPEIAPGEPGAEREDYRQVILERRLRQTLQRLNPQVPADALDEAFRKLTRPDSTSLVASNQVVHKYLVEGVPVEYQRPDGSMGGDLVRVLDFDNIENNEFLVVNQFTVVEGQEHRRADVVLFINGLPLGVLELKNPADPNARSYLADTNYNLGVTYYHRKKYSSALKEFEKIPAGYGGEKNIAGKISQLKKLLGRQG